MQNYIDFCREAVKPIKFCCFKKRTSCYCCFRGVFGTTTQLGLILQKTFEGHPIQILVDEKKKINLDCMFFTATCEPINDGVNNKYKELPTFIFCNPNAMYY